MHLVGFIVRNTVSFTGRITGAVTLFTPQRNTYFMEALLSHLKALLPNKVEPKKSPVYAISSFLA